VLNSTAVLRLNFGAKLNICASISATSPSRKTLSVSVKDSQPHIQAHLVLPTHKADNKTQKRLNFAKARQQQETE
jgi:hypothetical protein